MQDDARSAPPPWNDDRWRSFAAFAAHLLTKPAFDREEREPRLRVAGDLAEALAQVSSDLGHRRNGWSTCSRPPATA